ncbi:hypothetical protein ADK55_12920 [Streptomyces sp. WM4235]|uniref:hypothetical protein n=1 Tax=Streptomyces sp. WM4235 TaxID=1415551 RepID=UPI0006AE6BEA|nr:hypothetical protein [Streptomyces sp. WM4235]KOU56709.1 hypothetical protein ADK55_12920 [Streptomyces sp. WM4235]
MVQGRLAQAGDLERLLHLVDTAEGRETWWAEQTPLDPAVEDESSRLRALCNLRVLQDYVHRWLVALDSEHVDTTGLAAGARDVTVRLDETTSVLREVLVGLPVDRAGLPGDRAPTVADLVAARTRGDVRAAEADFEQRLAATRTQLSARMGWTVTVNADRGFDARSDQGIRVRARSVLPAAFESQLTGWTVPPPWPDVHYQGGRPTRLPAQLDLTFREMQLAPSAWDLDDFERHDAEYAAGPHADQVAGLLQGLRERLAPEDVPAFFADRCAALNTTAAQLPELLPDPDGLEEPHTYAGARTWVDPATIVRTPDHVAWGTINRDGDRAGAVWIPNAIRQWLTCDDVPGLLREAMTGGSPVQLHRVAGPAGPLHTMITDGTHRAHLWRILDLPRLFAYVDGTVMPRRLTPSTVCGDGAQPDAPDQVAAVWAGLHAKGILRGRLPHPGSGYGELTLHSVPALWLLYPPALAVAYGQRYSEIYPGAWEGAGIPADVFTSQASWVAWATGR